MKKNNISRTNDFYEVLLGNKTLEEALSNVSDEISKVRKNAKKYPLKVISKNGVTSIKLYYKNTK